MSDAELEVIEGEIAKESEAVEEIDILADVPPEDKIYAKGFNPDDPKGKTLSEFILTGKLHAMQKAANKQKAREERIDIATARLLKAENIALRKQLDEAINNSDHKAVHDIQAEINELQKIQPPAEQITRDPVVAEWEANNAWIFDDADPRTPKAKELFVKLSKEYSLEEALGIIDNVVNKPTPASRAPRTMTSQTPVGKPSTSNSKLTMASLTAEEKKMRNTEIFSWASDAEYLKIIEDERKKS